MAVQSVQTANCVIVDPGSRVVKIGFAADPAPLFNKSAEEFGATLADEGTGPRPIIQDGLVAQPRAFAEALHNVFVRDMQRHCMDRMPVMMPVSHFYTLQQLYGIAEELLRYFAGVAFHSAGSCALYSTGRVSGVIVDMGAASTRICYAERGVLSRVICVQGVGGDYVLRALDTVLRQKVAAASPAFAIDEKRFGQLKLSIVRSCLAVSADYERDLTIARRTGAYTREFLVQGAPETPGSKVDAAATVRVSLAEEIVSICEDVLMIGKGLFFDTLRGLVAECGTPEIHLTGGFSLIQGMDTRIKCECPECTVFASRDRHLAIWNGAAAMVGVDILNDILIYPQSLHEEGPSLVDRLLF